jgi:hypothetical protein
VLSRMVLPLAGILALGTLGFSTHHVPVSHGSSHSRTASQHPKWTLFGPLPADMGGIDLLIRWNDPTGPRSFTMSDFRHSHFSDHGLRFTTLMPSTHVAPYNSVTNTKVLLNRPIPIHTSSWVRSVTLHPIGSNVLIICVLKRPASHYDVGSDPMDLIFSFSR